MVVRGRLPGAGTMRDRGSCWVSANGSGLEVATRATMVDFQWKSARKIGYHARSQVQEYIHNGRGMGSWFSVGKSI